MEDLEYANLLNKVSMQIPTGMTPNGHVALLSINQSTNEYICDVLYLYGNDVCCHM